MKAWISSSQSVALLICLITLIRFGYTSVSSGSFPSEDSASGGVCEGVWSFAEDLEIESDALIGEGANGKVSIGYYKATGEKVALKQLTLPNPSPEDLDLMFERISVYKELDHPNIAKFKKCYDVGGTIWIVMEYADGKDLRRFMDSGFGRETINYIMHSIMAAVDYIHSLEAMHLDIKPENIIITRDGRVKLIDFDFVSKITGHDPANPVGTLQYMAPEVLMHRMYLNYPISYNHMADIWSCGIVFYELFHKRPPAPLSFEDDESKLFEEWCAEAEESLGNRVDDGPVWARIKNHPEWDELLKNMLAWLPYNRFSSKDLWDEFGGLLKDGDEVLIKQELAEIYDTF